MAFICSLVSRSIRSIVSWIKFGIGPSIENGFYYDIDLPEGEVITDADFGKIEAKMKELAQQKNEYHRSEVAKSEALDFYGKKGDEYKVELIDELEDNTITFLQTW